MKLTRGKLIATIAGVLAVALVARATRPKPIEVETAIATRGRLESTIDADGRTRVRQRYVIVAPVAGRVARLVTREGAAVRRGEVVARIAPLPLDEQALTAARSRVDAASALALHAAAQLRAAQADLEQRQRDLSRARVLVEAGGAAPRVAEDAALAAKGADEAVTGAAERVRAADADVRQARAALAGIDGGSATVLVRAPASGRVLRMAEQSERVVSPGTPLLEIGDPRALEIVIDVLSSDGAMVRPGQLVRLGDWSGDIEEEQTGFSGTVRDVEPAAFTKLSALGVEEQRVNVVVDAAGAPAGLGDGYRVEASIVIWTASDVLALPVGALVRPRGGDDERGRWGAFIAQAGRAKWRQLRVGHLGGGRAEVLHGLSAGDTVIVFPSDQVQDGRRVAPRRE